MLKLRGVKNSSRLINDRPRKTEAALGVDCRESEKKQLLEKANKVYKGSAVLTPYVEDADVLVIVEEPDDTMQQKIKESRYHHKHNHKSLK